MPFPQPFLRHTMIWQLPGGEVATTSCAWNNEAGGILATPTDEALGLANKGLALWNSIKGSFPIVTNYIGSRTSWVGVTGATIETIETGHAPANGFADAHSLPTECAVVASLRTATHSRSGRGRMYLPAPAHTTLQDSGRLTAATTATLADGMETYLGAATFGTDEMFPVVASKLTNALRRITEVRVGDVVDSQRRRRDALVEVSSNRVL